MDISNLVCCICHKVPSGVAESDCCNSLFCWDCVLALGKAPCPSCGKTLDPGMCSENKAIEKLIEKFPVKCKYENCNVTAALAAMRAHESECEHAIVMCPNSELCGFLTKNELTTHERETCPYRIVECHSCDERLPLNLLQGHLEQTCTGVIVGCPLNCDAHLQRSLLNGHLAHECPNTLVGCPFGVHGCEQVVMRAQLENHLNADSGKHLLMVTSLVEAQQREIDGLRTRVQQLQVSNAPVLNVEQLLPMLQTMLCDKLVDFQPMAANFVADVRARLRWATLFWVILILFGLASVHFLIRWVILIVWFARGYKKYVKPFKWDLRRKSRCHVKFVNFVYLVSCLHLFLLVNLIC